MTAKELEEKLHRDAIARLAQAFKDLPNDLERLDAVAGLAGIMKKQLAGRDGLLDEWMEQAHGTLKASVMIFGAKMVAPKKEGK